MFHPHPPALLRAAPGRPKVVRLALAASLVLPAGCANPGPPQPPSLRLPAQAAGLRAERAGQQVLLTWTTPDKTSDGLALKGAVTAVLCREIAPPPDKMTNPACSPIARLPVSAGPGHAADTLPASLLRDPPRLLAYRIELFNPAGRSARPSAPAFAAAGVGPSDPGPLHITPARKGALIQWQPPPDSSPTLPATAVELTRVLIPSPQPPQGSPAPAPSEKSPLALAFPATTHKDPTAPVLLRASLPGAATTSQTDPGGLIDPGVLPHNTYTYTAERVRTVTLEGHTLDLRSSPSAVASFTFEDIFPPRPPTGLASIASAPLTGPSSIDLSWEPGPEPDLLGYNVYRADAPPGRAPGPFRRLNAEPLAAPSFRDLSAQPGQPYLYRLTAVDQAGNESESTPSLRETIRELPR